MAIKRISELDVLSINFDEIKTQLLSSDENGVYYFKKKDDASFSQYVFETSVFDDVKDNVPSYYVSKQISNIDLANLLTLEVKANINYILNEDTVFRGEKKFTENISAIGDINYINNLKSNEISCSGNISALGEENFINKLSCNELYLSGDFSSNGNISCTGNISCGENISCAGDISCDELYGVALSAKWADLAEFYESDYDYEPGTLVKFGGEKELTIADYEANAVITTSPGLVLNGGKQENKLMKGIALIGRVPVKVFGEIHKFDNISLSREHVGCAVKSNLGDLVIGKALETNYDFGTKLVECVVKLTF